MRRTRIEYFESIPHRPRKVSYDEALAICMDYVEPA